LRTFIDIYGDSPLSPYRPHPSYEDGEEAFDAIVQADTTLILVQIKGLYTLVQAKTSGTGDAFFAGINDKFGLEHGGALEQHLRNIVAVFARDSARRRTVTTIPVTQVRSLIPVVITQEPLLRFGLVTKILADAFMTAVAEAEPLVDTVTVQRPVFVSIDELESLVPYLVAGDLTLVQALRVKTGNTHPLLSFWEAFQEEYLLSGRLSRRENQLLKARFSAISSAALQRFEMGYYQ
jgi:hypothetical protein